MGGTEGGYDGMESGESNFTGKSADVFFGGVVTVGGAVGGGTEPRGAEGTALTTSSAGLGGVGFEMVFALRVGDGE